MNNDLFRLKRVLKQSSTGINYNNLTLTHADRILRYWAATKENWKYHHNWIDKLDRSSKEKFFNDYRDKCPGDCLEQTQERLIFLLKE